MKIKSLSISAAQQIWELEEGNPTRLVEDELKGDEQSVAFLIDEFVADHPEVRAGQLDNALGLQLYDSILSLDNGFTLRQAADNGVWRRLALQVVPEHVRSRWPEKNGSQREQYFWKGSSRLWMKSIWWYCHLSWQGDRESTADVLENGTTDTRSALVERPGPGGFRVELCREIMKRLADIPNEDAFRKIMKLNTAKVRLVEPEFYRGETAGYVDNLLKTGGIV
ncbi:DUF6339 family protein [Verrucomicrobiales bacterium]|nr:DUF6339 family protein [Verrucomicrobiales bacterium]